MRIKWNYELLEQIINENSLILKKDYKNEKLNKEYMIEGKCINSLCVNYFCKSFRTLFIRKNFGCTECCFYIGNERLKQTFQNKYGVNNPSKIKENREKAKHTTFERHGVENYRHHPDCQTKMNNTCFEKYGVTHYSQTDMYREQTQTTNMGKYGVNNVMQNPKILEKMISSAFSLKEYILPSGKIIFIQGYEHLAIDELLFKENIDENDIITGVQKVPEIIYYDENNKLHKHFPDIFIISQNRCIEVKSEWTKKMQIKYVFLKLEAGQKMNYLYELWVYNKKGEKVECYK
jgi:hypothetical protein